MTVSIATLLDGHDAIARSARLILAMIAPGGPPPSRVPGWLASLAATVAMHEAQERDFVYRIGGERDDDSAAIRFAGEHAVLTRDWMRYLAAWPSQRIVSEPADFRFETRTILARMLDRIECENRFLYAHHLALDALTAL